MANRVDADFDIKGNVSGQIIAGNHNIQIQHSPGSIVNIAPRSNQPRYSMLPFPVKVLPGDFPFLLDRTQDRESLKTAIQTSTPVSIFGEEGIGKTSFVKHTIHRTELSAFSSGTVFLNVSGRGVDDLLQFLFENFSVSQSEYKPTDAEIRRELQSLKAVIFLDDLQLDRDKTTVLRDAAPRCTFILSSNKQSIRGEGRVIPLKGLPEVDAVTLFENELGRSLNKSVHLNETERTAVRKLCILHQGHPLRIELAAALVAKGTKSISQLLKESERDDPEKVLLQASLYTLNEYQERVLALLAAAGGSKVLPEHLASLSKDPHPQKNIQGLVALGLIRAHDSGFSLTGNLSSSLAALWDVSVWEDRLLDYFTRWLEGQPPQAMIEESASALIYTLHKASEKQQWTKVIRFGRALEHGLILAKRWQAWADLLNQLMNAAKALGDRNVEAWALHQLGSRAVGLGHADQAQTLFTKALNIRKAINDKAGLKVTQHNLNTLHHLPLPLKGGGSSGLRRLISVRRLLGIGVSLLVAAIVVYAAFSLFAPSSPLDTVTPLSTDTSALIPRMTLTPQGSIYGPDPEDFPPGISPLTGLTACDSSLLNFPAVLVSITHFPASARPQAGLSFSSIVFEILIDTVRQTRFLAVFYGDCVPDEIGPIRSGRPPYVQIREAFQASCMVISSGSERLLRNLPVCKNVYAVNDVNSAFLSVADMYKVARENPRGDQNFNYTGNMFSDIAPSGELSAAESLNVFYHRFNQTQWRYNPSSGKYLRSVNIPTEEQANEFNPATDRLTGEQLSFSNIIVLLAKHTVEQPEVIHINLQMNQAGNAYLFRDGKVFEILWTTVNGEYEQINGLRRPIRFTDEGGNPILLKPGNTWIHVMSLASVVQQSGDGWEVHFND